MDPTKPILDLYGDNDYSRPEKSRREDIYYNGHASKYNSRVSNTHHQKSHRKPSSRDIQGEYDSLWQNYNDKSSKLTDLEYQLHRAKTSNQNLHEQLELLRQRNTELNQNLLSKNAKLEESYRRLQDQLNQGNRSQINQQPLHRLEEGINDTVNENYRLLREAILSQVRALRNKY